MIFSGPSENRVPKAIHNAYYRDARVAISLAKSSICVSSNGVMAQLLRPAIGACIMATPGGRRGIARFAMTFWVGALSIGLSAEAAPLSDTPPDPHGVPTVYRSDALDAYAKVTIGWLPTSPALTAAEQAPDATALVIINQRMAEVAA
jgi:hypothetical protein